MLRNKLEMAVFVKWLNVEETADTFHAAGREELQYVGNLCFSLSS